MTFSEMLEAAWELAEAASKDLSVEASFRVYRSRDDDGKCFNQVRYAINVHNNRRQYCSVYVTANTPEHALEQFKEQLPTTYSADESLFKSADESSALYAKSAPHSIFVTLTGWCGELPLSKPLYKQKIPVVGESLYVPLSGGGDFLVVARVDQVEDPGDGRILVRAAVRGLSPVDRSNDA